MAKREKKLRNKGSAGNNRKSGEDFLLQNGKKEGVAETESGLQYLVVEEKNGLIPVMLDTVKIHQRALLLDGKILEDTYRQNKTDEVNINELIEGLQEGLQMMSVGSRYKFWVHMPIGRSWSLRGSKNIT